MDRAFQRSRSLMLRGTFYSVPPKYIENSGDIKSMEIYFGIKELIRLNLLKRHPPYTLGVDMQNHSLNVNGQLICKMLSLHKIDIDSINAVDNIFKKMGVKKL